jgi:transposase
LYSRKAYSEAVDRQTTDNFIRCLENAFVQLWRRSADTGDRLCAAAHNRSLSSRSRPEGVLRIALSLAIS